MSVAIRLITLWLMLARSVHKIMIAMDIGHRVNLWLNLKHHRYAYSAYKLINIHQVHLGQIEILNSYIKLVKEPPDIMQLYCCRQSDWVLLPCEPFHLGL